MEVKTSTNFSESDMMHAAAFPPFKSFNEDREPLLAFEDGN